MISAVAQVAPDVSIATSFICGALPAEKCCKVSSIMAQHVHTNIEDDKIGIEKYNFLRMVTILNAKRSRQKRSDKMANSVK